MGADEDKLVKERIDARNGLESFVYNLKNTLDDDDKGVADKISPEDMKELQDLIDETLDWMEENPEAEKEVENISNPIMRQMYAGGEGGEDEDMGDFGDDE